MESFITFFTQFLGKHLSKEGVIFLISVFPVLELRGGLIAASLLKVPFLKGLLISLIGNVLPIPFVLLFFSKIVTLLEKFSYTKPLAGWFREKVDKNKTFGDLHSLSEFPSPEPAHGPAQWLPAFSK